MSRTTTRPLLAVTAAAEGVTGATLIASPPLVASLLLNAEVSGAGLALGRVCGVALLALAWACWPSGDNARAVAAMLLYSVLSTAYLTYLGSSGAPTGHLLWPAVAYHALVTLLLARAWTRERGEPR